MDTVPTAEEIERVAKQIYTHRFGEPNLYPNVVNSSHWYEAAKWHLIKLAKVTNERDALRKLPEVVTIMDLTKHGAQLQKDLDEAIRQSDAALRQGELYRQETLRWREADKKTTLTVNALRLALAKIMQQPTSINGAWIMQEVAREALEEPK